jgi:hypothetical protein
MSSTILCTGAVQTFESGLAAPKFAFATVTAAATDTAIVAAVSGRRIRVLDVKLTTTVAATGITFNTKPSGAGVAITPAFTVAVDVVSFGFNQLGHFQTSVGEGLSATTGAGNSIGVQITYIEV